MKKAPTAWAYGMTDGSFWSTNGLQPCALYHGSWALLGVIEKTDVW